MPDHVHLILTPLDVALERAVGYIKGGFSHRLASKLPVWQRGFTDHRIRDAADLQARRAYLHMNPVRAGLAAAAELYPYSSAYRPSSATSGAEAHSP
jgi:putative transposase